MKKIMKKMLAIVICIIFTANIADVTAFASGDETDTDIADGVGDIDVDNIEINAKSALLMDADTGTVLFTKNSSEPLPPASVTKIMTLLLVAEGIADGSITLDQKVMVSANAASMGGSQIFIKEGEEFTVEELLKSTVIASANDAAVALAELMAGTEAAFVERMNKRADALGMKNTYFENCTGLDDTAEKHLTSAYDIALMSKELMRHNIICKYSSVWQDSIRDGEFILTNTNRLVRFYNGCTGLKTGSTDKAGFCVSATAKRDGMHLIAVIMGAENREERNNAARALLDFGFANYSVYKDGGGYLETSPVLSGKQDDIDLYVKEFTKLVARSDKGKVEKIYEIPDTLCAPLHEGMVVGRVDYKIGDEIIGSSDIYVSDGVEKITVIDLFCRLFLKIIRG